ncbi:hypothetical protein CDD81_2143 [Ophiocordyceps australis]|uniref:Uncharacterized protein n=1 Tax=Ophiocordyceps australis TaxID=1399860 RepID=A0A2C5XUC9_9HYPO|nr:hypothetical protein CDD81_2143 [Ophiocordyceps australis]
MGAFFTSWESWQDMTFVLGCCIVLVFAVGVLKLWWSNRQLRKHEVIEEERRARLAEMRCCGISAIGPSEIPFGVRALQSGVEVEGIWISQSNTPTDSPRNSLMTLAKPKDKGKGRAVDVGAPSASSPLPMREERPSAAHAVASLASVPSLAEPPLEQPDDFDCIAEAPPQRAHVHVARESATPRRASHNDGQGYSAIPTCSTLQDAYVGGVPLGHRCRSCGYTEAPLYGAAAVYANKTMRRSNAGFEVLPAGLLGPRQELLAPDADSGAEDDEDDDVHGAKDQVGLGHGPDGRLRRLCSWRP